MPSQHIGEKPDHQSGRFREYPEYFNQRHDRKRKLQPSRYIRPKNVFPIPPRSRYIHDNKSTQSQYQRNREISGHISSPGKNGNHPHYIGYENKEKYGQQIRGITLSFFSQYPDNNFPIQHLNNHLNESQHLTRSFPSLSFIKTNQSKSHPQG